MKFSIDNREIDFQINKETGQIFCTSLDVAKVFEKRHADVLEIIKDLKEDKEIQNFNERNFRLVNYKDKKGESRPCYKISRDGFSFVAMGLTGAKARKWKCDFIDAFNFMERELRTLKENAQASLERPKEVFNLIYDTPCRSAVLNAVSKMEKENNTKAKSVRSYKILEEFDGKTINNVLDIGIDWDTSSSLTKKQEIALASGKFKVVKR